MLVQPLGELMGARRLFGGGERGAVPGRVARAVAELAERGGTSEVAGDPVAAGRERDESPVVEPRRGRRRHGRQREPGELAQRVEHRHVQFGVATGERRAVVEQHLAQPHEGVVDVGHARALDLLVA